MNAPPRFKRRLTVVMTVGLLGGPATVGTQTTEGALTACAGPASHRFDFWAGDWSVESRIDSTGDRLVLVGTDVEVAAAEGFEAPRFEVTGLDGGILSGDSLRGPPVLVDFWSTACSYSEDVRPALNALTRRFADEGLVRISIAREQAADEVRPFLDDHPRMGTVVAGAGPVWERFKPDLVTPAFHLIDREGGSGSVAGGQGTWGGWRWPRLV